MERLTYVEVRVVIRMSITHRPPSVAQSALQADISGSSTHLLSVRDLLHH